MRWYIVKSRVSFVGWGMSCEGVLALAAGAGFLSAAVIGKVAAREKAMAMQRLTNRMETSILLCFEMF
jgi:hypothetical protein